MAINEEINKVVLTLINTYSELPVKKVEYQQLPAKSSGMSLSSLAGEIIVSEDILGNYTAKYPFAIYYRVLPQGSTDRISAETVLNNIGVWLEDMQTYPNIGKNRKITKIKRESAPTIISRAMDGSVDYQAIFSLEYEVKEI